MTTGNTSCFTAHEITHQNGRSATVGRPGIIVTLVLSLDAPSPGYHRFEAFLDRLRVLLLIALLQHVVRSEVRVRHAVIIERRAESPTLRWSKWKVSVCLWHEEVTWKFYNTTMTSVFAAVSENSPTIFKHIRFHRRLIWGALDKDYNVKLFFSEAELKSFFL